MNLDEKIARLKETAARKVAEAKKAAPDRQLKLELWPEEVRGVPNAALRTAMFTAGKERVFLKEWTPIASVQGIEISARGERQGAVKARHLLLNKELLALVE